MAAIDLLFDHKADSERLHQVVLSVLLLRSRLLEHLLSSPGLRATDYRWEAEGRLYDLGVSVTDPSGNIDKVFVEIKIDSDLGKSQFQRQLQHAAKDKKARLVYLILGLTQVATPAETLTKWATEQRTELGGEVPAVCYVSTARLSQLLSDPKAIITGETQAQRQNVRDLVVSYRDALDRLEARTSQFADKALSSWEAADYYGFFDGCRRQVLSMAKAGISYEANPKGGFVACHWHFTKFAPIDDIRLYLQFEEDRLCFKLKVPDEHKALRKKIWDAAQAALRACPGPFSQSLQPTNYHNGTYMTFAALAGALGQDRLDQTRVVGHIADAEALRELLVEKLQKDVRKLFEGRPGPTSTGPST